MPITTECPRCRTRYQVQESLVGQKMRCPEQRCRHVFEVRDIVAPAAAPGVAPVDPNPNGPARTQHKDVWTGSVSDLVPLVPVESVTAEPPMPEPPPDLPLVSLEGAELIDVPEVRSWEQPPPVRGGAVPPPPAPPRTKTTTKKRTTSKAITEVPVTPPPEPPGPVEVEHGQWGAPPPVREGKLEQPETPAEPHDHIEAPAPADEPDLELAVQQRKKRRARWLMVGIAAAVVMILGGAGGTAWYLLMHTEERLYHEAAKAYEEESFVVAAGKFEKLAEAFPDSERADEYRFLVDLSRIRSLVQDPQVESENALGELEKYLAATKDSPHLKPHARELGQSLVKRLDRYTEQAMQQADGGQESVKKKAEKSLADARKALPGAITDQERERLSSALVKIGAKIQRARDIEEELAKIELLAADRNVKSLKSVRRYVKTIGGRFPEVPGHPRTLQALAAAEQGHFDSVRFVPADDDRPAPPVVREDTESDIVVDAPLVRAAKGPDTGELVFALARGVLYALRASDGETAWARRVGIDTAQLPLRLAATPAVPTERLLVLSSDPDMLTALDLRNRVLWRYRLDAPCLSQPIVHGDKAWLPTVRGDVHEVELATGQLLGRYRTGHRFTLGGVLDPRTGKLYLPADDLCLYVLDVTPGVRKLEAVVYTNHASGALRGAPLLLASPESDREDPGAVPSYLVLQSRSGLDATDLRVYALPLQRDSQPPAMRPEPRLRGWSWFTPYHDDEKVAILSDAGALGLFGIRQPNNQDNPLFPVVPLTRSREAAGEAYAGIDLRPLLGSSAKNNDNGEDRGRAQISHVNGNDLWVLDGGRFQRLQLRFTSQHGPQLVPRWGTALDLGSPLHESRLHSPGGRSTLMVVSQPLRRQVSLATAVEPEASEGTTPRGDNRVRWQRQLGLVCLGDPQWVGEDLIVPDQGGGLYRFRPERFPSAGNTRYRSSSQMVAPAVDHNPSLPRFLLRSADGKTAWQILSLDPGSRLLLREYSEGEAGTDRVVDLPRGSTLAGEPALVGTRLVVPLSDGTLVRYSLPPGDPDPGPNWRARNAPSGAVCHVVPLGGDRFLTTDGRRGLTCWRWKDNKDNDYAVLPEGTTKDPPLHELAERLATRPLSLGGDEPRVLVGDVRGGLTLLRGEKLEPARRWELNGAITAGPFLRGKQVYCVVDRQRLVALDPEREGLIWSYKHPAAIVSEPHLAGGLMVVADEAGLFVGLNAKGAPVGPGYRLKATVAPVAAPEAFGEGRVFAPLSDGTVLLLSLAQLRPELWEVPLWQSE